MNTATKSIAAKIREQVIVSGDRLWTYQDFAQMPMSAVSQALSRLTREGELRRVRRGIYYRPRQTLIGESKASPLAIADKVLGEGTRPAGLTAAHVLGLTTQNPARLTYAVCRRSVPVNLSGIKVETRRQASCAQLPSREAALLEFLRDRGRYSDLEPQETKKRLLQVLREQGVFERLANAAIEEPPRVRAILGALGQEAGIAEEQLQALRSSLNGLSRFDFGHLSELAHAREWQAR